MNSTVRTIDRTVSLGSATNLNPYGTVSYRTVAGVCQAPHSQNDLKMTSSPGVEKGGEWTPPKLGDVHS